MNDRPEAAELLPIARRTLLDQVLPRLPQDLRYCGLMIANAMAIAQREIAAGDSAARAELGRLHRLLGDPADCVAGEDLRAALANRNRRLAAEIRAGTFDHERRAALLDHLLETAIDKLAVSNPKALET